MKKFNDFLNRRGGQRKDLERGDISPAPPAKVIAEHTVVKGDTLSAIALKYYGNSDRKYYMYIYNRNKDVIGNDPDMIMIGIKLKIYELPEDFKAG